MADHPVKNGAFVESVPRVLQKVFHRERGLVRVKLKADITLAGVNGHLGIAIGRLGQCNAASQHRAAQDLQ